MKRILLILMMLTQSLWVFGQAGSLDPSFNPEPNNGANGRIWDITVQDDDNILLVGEFTLYNDTSRRYIAKLHPSGFLDDSFIPGNGPNSSLLTSKTLHNGKIIIGGLLTSYNGVPRNRIAQLNSDGSLDTNFDPGLGADRSIWAIAVQPDGKIIIGGDFTTFDGTEINRVARLNPNGSLDLTFNPGIGTNDRVRAIEIQSDGKILIGGSFTTYDNVPRNRLARLNLDGSLDTEFDPGEGASNLITSIKLSTEGKIFLGGAFTFFDGKQSPRIVCLNSNGEIDNSFIVLGGNNQINSMSLQPDNKIIIGGTFTFFNGEPRNRIARLNLDGSLDLSFDPQIGADNVIFPTALQKDGKILIGGFFTSYDNVSRGRIARILNDLDPCETNTAPEINTITGPEGPLPLGSDAAVEVDFSDENISSVTWKVFDGNTVIEEFTDEVTGDKASRTFQNLPTGVFSILMELEDECGEITEEQYDYVVIFDPDGGFVTGGGWIQSPEGAYAVDPTLTGRANFGFVAKYKKGRNNTNEVGGNTEFQFKAADLNFKSSSHDDMSLVIANHKAIYKGKGNINGQDGYAFMVSAIDGKKQPNSGPDKFRIKIWSEGSQEVIYDNQMNASENEDPSTVIGGGSIVIHEPARGNQNKRMEEEEEGEENEVSEEEKEIFEILNVIDGTNQNQIKIYPNPANHETNVLVNLVGESNVEIRIFDAAGRLVFSEESFEEQSFTRSIQLDGLSSGLYNVVVKVNHQFLQGRLIKK